MNTLRPGRRFRGVWIGFSLLLAGTWALGQWLRDRTWLTGLMFYIPSPVVCAWLLLATWRTGFSDSATWRRWVLPILLVCPAWYVVAVENHWFMPTIDLAQGQDVLRLVHWNIGRPSLQWGRQQQLIQTLKPDVLVLSEVSAAVRDSDLPDYFILRRGSMLVAARWPVATTGSLVPGGAVQAFCVRATGAEPYPTLVIGDMTSNLRLARDPFLRPMVDISGRLEADIIVGDMNAPRRSLAFTDLPGGYRHAYDVAGAGWSYTWPIPVPVLAIDQCVCGPRVHPVRYDLQSSVFSDHRIQILDFVFISSK